MDKTTIIRKLGGGRAMKMVVYGATRNIYHNMVVCANSALINGNIDEAILLTEDDIFPAELPTNRRRIINVSRQAYFNTSGPNATKRWTWMVLMKAAVSKLFHEFDRILFLDCDTIVEHDLSELWELDMTDYYYAAVKQPTDGRGGAFSKGADYFNCGVLLCNLEKLRDGTEDRIIHALNTKPYDFPEQDCINELCQGKILELPGRYNVSNYTVPDTEVYVRHFAADPSWIYSEYFRKYDKEV